jgi:hypothetical protein
MRTTGTGMSSHHLSEDRCLDYLTGELSTEERALVAKHLEGCLACRDRVKEYEELLRVGLPSIANEVAIDAASAQPRPWSFERGEKRLRAALEFQEDGCLETHVFGSKQAGANRVAPRFGGHPLSAKTWMGAAIAATIVVGFVASESIYRLGVRHGKEQHQLQAVQPQTQTPLADDRNLRADLEKLRQERDKLQAGLQVQGSLVAQLRSQIEQQRRQTEITQASLESANHQTTAQIQQVSSQRDEVARKLEDEQALLSSKQKEFDSAQQSHSNDALRLVSLENRIQQMTDLLKEKDLTIEDREKMLSRGRDIRDLVGARDLYMAEVYEVAGNGEKKKPWGRVFLTKGKSLIFYGYDLDQQPGLTNTSTFQAWGNRGPDRKNALNLGIMYADGTANGRWVLEFDDPKRLAEINAVFITVEPDGKSRFPRGKQVLFAYLKEEPNHP